MFLAAFAKRNNKTLFLWLTLFLLIYGGIRGYYRLTDDFRLGNIQYSIPIHPEWEVTSGNNEEQLQSIFNQKFTYIGKGSQAYVFSSEDEQYVLKFFKFKHLRPSLFLEFLAPLPVISSYRDKQVARKERKLLSIFNGYKLAFDLDRKESGLLFIQLNPDHVNRYVTVVDKIGLEHQINLGELPFVLQEKGETLRSVLSRALAEGNPSLAKQRIRQIIDLYLSEYQKGIFDHDHGVMQNTGFIGDRPLHLDVGKMKAAEEMKSSGGYEPDLILVATKIKQWVEIHHPQYANEMVDDLQKKLSQVFSRDFHFSK